MTTTKSKKKSSLIAASAVLLAVMMTASACGSDDNAKNNAEGSAVEQPSNAAPDNTSNNTTNNSNTSNNQAEGQNNGVVDPETASPDVDANAAPEDSAVKTGEGVFAGQADTTSVEIDLPEGPMVLQFTDELADEINSIPADTKVTFEYTEKVSGDVTQYFLKKLEAKS
ncbi:hypothetical protein [Paenibacillus glycanilyticus]|uniref:Copper-binding protein n=1 Tax=Paenibacillus glycanilyticus TaxID=126569 RepID=A0ABQ6GF58_9BACL|nr:hypothetical protein [Paenibacillus glycanilyticus]GLX67672.1 hypothetical protein MU1_20170 [Paenibacillus glycanilyticus]